MKERKWRKQQHFHCVHGHWKEYCSNTMCLLFFATTLTETKMNMPLFIYVLWVRIQHIKSLYEATELLQKRLIFIVLYRWFDVKIDWQWSIFNQFFYACWSSSVKGKYWTNWNSKMILTWKYNIIQVNEQVPNRFATFDWIDR